MFTNGSKLPADEEDVIAGATVTATTGPRAHRDTHAHSSPPGPCRREGAMIRPVLQPRLVYGGKAAGPVLAGGTGLGRETCRESGAGASFEDPVCPSESPTVGRAGARQAPNRTGGHREPPSAPASAPSRPFLWVISLTKHGPGHRTFPPSILRNSW